MRKYKHLLLILFSSVLLIQTNKAQSFYAQVSSKKVQVGVPFEYSVVFTINTGNYTPPNFKDFDVVSGPSQSSSYQNINGVGSQQIIISYGLVAKKEGKLTIGPSITMAGSQKLETAAITVEAVKGKVSGSQAEEDNATVSKEDVFMNSISTKHKVYEGELLTVTHKIYSRLQIVGIKKHGTPAYNGFWSKNLEPTPAQQQNIDGVPFLVGEYSKSILIPNKNGNLRIEPFDIELVVRKISKKPRSFFDQVFGNQSYEDIVVKVLSKPVTIEVMPLPEKDKPENFNGAVGNFSSKVTVSKNSVKANEAINLKITVSGSGNLPLINAPKLNLPEGFETYDPKTSEGANSKTFDYLIIPRNEGDFILNNLDFSFFNIETKKYVTLPSGEIAIKVLPPDPNSAGAQVYSPQSQIKETENDIRYIKKGDFILAKTETEFFNSFTHILFLVLPILALGLGLFARRNYIKSNSNIVLVKERKAAKLAKKQLITAEKWMSQNKKDEFYTEVLTALNNYISNKLNIPIADLSRENISNNLVQRKIDTTTIQKLSATLETSEYAKYAPGAVSGDLQQVYRNTVDLIADIEQQLNKKV